MTHRPAQDWVLVVNGELDADHSSNLVGLLRDSDRFVAVDGGLNHCVAIGVWPDLVIGDLDSASNELMHIARDRGIEFETFPANKDATDLELAIELALESGATSLTVVAAFGGRLDHELATISLLASKRWRSMQIRATDGTRDLYVVHQQVSLRVAVGATVSLLPWHGGASGVSTQGMQWPLDDATLAAGSTQGVSNLAVDPHQQVIVRNGVVIVVTDPTSP